jgi:hypothetical protein
MTAHGAGQTIVCILGTPRSGTSLTARLLNVAGLFIGEEDELHPPGPGNPAGFWETRRAARLNHRILFEFLGIDNSDAPNLAPGWERSPELDVERERARALIAEVFGDHSVWGWKDPRNSITLPFWQRLLPPMRYVICLRNPVDMAASGALFARERGVTPDRRRSFALWECYVASAIVNTSGQPRMFARYEDYFHDWRAAADRLAGFAGLGPVTGTDKEREIDRHLDDRLRHHGTPPDLALADPDLPSGARALFRALLDDLTTPEDLDALARRVLEERAAITPPVPARD